MATKLQRSYLPTSGASRVAAICCLTLFCVGLGFPPTVSAGASGGMEGRATAVEAENEQKRLEDMYHGEVERSAEKTGDAIENFQDGLGRKERKPKKMGIIPK